MHRTAGFEHRLDVAEDPGPATGAHFRELARHHARHDRRALEFVNETSWHHPIHLHGHVFRVVSVNGKQTLPRQWADTVLLDPDSRAVIAFVAENPGDWMLHCHVLEHQASGMMAVVHVS